MRFVVLGAGGVGGYFGGKLAAAGGDVVFIARGAHLEALRRDGLRVSGLGADFHVKVRATDRPAEAGHADALLVAVKTYDTEAAAAPCRELLRADSSVVSLQNGIGNEARLAAIFGLGRIVGGIAYVAAEVTAPGHILCDSPGRVVLGELDGRKSERVGAIAAAFEKAGVPCEVTGDLPQTIWEKMVANAVFNVIAAAFDVQLGDLLERRFRPLAEKAIAELVAVAKARGVVVRPEAAEVSWEFCRRYPKWQTSTQQDLARGRGTEWRTLSGALIEEAGKAGVAVPTHEMLLGKLKEREAAATSPRRA